MAKAKKKNVSFVCILCQIHFLLYDEVSAQCFVLLAHVSSDENIMFKHATPGITEAIILEADFTTNLKIIKTNNLSNEGVMWLKINGITWKLHRIS